LNALRDWGHARDYVEAQWLMLQQATPEDYVIATGVQHSVRDFVERAATELGIAVEWCGAGREETGVVRAVSGEEARKHLMPGQTIVRLDPRYLRPAEVETLLGDARKARERLGWRPRTSFSELVAGMIAADVKLARRELDYGGRGLKVFRPAPNDSSLESGA
jgi:GDPmannose 4,6-dehydratase